MRIFQSFRISEFQSYDSLQKFVNLQHTTINMTIKRFEDLEVWQNARKLCMKIRNAVNSTTLEKDFSIKDQILRSSGSVMDNIAEGFERDGKKEFINFLYIAKNTCFVPFF